VVQRDSHCDPELGDPAGRRPAPMGSVRARFRIPGDVWNNEGARNWATCIDDQHNEQPSTCAPIGGDPWVPSWIRLRPHCRHLRHYQCANQSLARYAARFTVRAGTRGNGGRAGQRRHRLSALAASWHRSDRRAIGGTDLVDPRGLCSGIAFQGEPGASQPLSRHGWGTTLYPLEDEKLLARSRCLASGGQELELQFEFRPNDWRRARARCGNAQPTDDLLTSGQPWRNRQGLSRPDNVYCRTASDEYDNDGIGSRTFRIQFTAATLPVCSHRADGDL
jgi:hypothetical protein